MCRRSIKITPIDSPRRELQIRFLSVPNGYELMILRRDEVGVFRIFLISLKMITKGGEGEAWQKVIGIIFSSLKQSLVGWSIFTVDVFRPMFKLTGGILSSGQIFTPTIF